MKLNLKFLMKTKPILFHNNHKDSSTTIPLKITRSYLEGTKVVEEMVVEKKVPEEMVVEEIVLEEMGVEEIVWVEELLEVTVEAEEIHHKMEGLKVGPEVL